MKKFKKIIPFIMILSAAFANLPMVAKADSSKVVTLGANLSDEQKSSMYEYFGTSADKVETIEVTNADERKYMEGIATEAQIGTRTFSCSYVEPTESGGIQVKTANLTFVTSSMIASTLMTSGVENCNVVAASPIEVSGTGALTGIMMAYETASGEELDEGQKAAATEELVTTGELADSIGQQEATDLMNDVKQDVIENDLSEEGEITDAVNKAAGSLNVTLTDDQIDKIVALMQKIAEYDYDVKSLKDTLENLEGKTEGFFTKIWNSIKGFFGGSDDGGILNNTNEDILGSNIVTDSTLDDIKEKVENADTEGWWDKVVNFFKNLFGGGDDDSDNTEETSSTEEDSSSDNSSAPAEGDSGEDDTSGGDDDTSGDDTEDTASQEDAENNDTSGETQE